ncbi:MAG: hypothetical protein M1831_007424 [Alyxoria varia]|nr:MAG: hypothetical protein M1831_007424 [Alyxoria varia]
MRRRLKKKLFDSREQSPQPTASSSTLETPRESSLPPASSPDSSGQLTQTADGPALISTNSNSSTTPIGEGQNYGVKVLYNGGIDACVDIVFVHGLTGNAYSTWYHKETKTHWPSQLLGKDISNSRILSFGYDADVLNILGGKGPASNSRLSNHAESLIGTLADERERSSTETRKIIFVAHSLGGLVAEQALTLSKHSPEKHLKHIELYTAGIVFLGVPHCGSELEAWATIGRRMLNVLVRTNKDIVKVLHPDSEMLHQVENNFQKILRQRQGTDDSVAIIVPQRSAKIAGYSFYGIRANHMDMTKFPNQDHPGYRKILGELERWTKEICQEKQTNSQPGCEVWMIPRTTSRLYVGRKQLSKRLSQAFLFDHSMPPAQQRVFVIKGIGGTGKSEVCLKFAEDHRDEYWGVFWLDAGTVSTAKQGIINIGQRCGRAEQNVASIKSWLASQTNRWLIIIDNADKPDVDYSEYIPPSKGGDIVLSTRNPECIQLETVGYEILEDLEPELARELLFKASSTPESQWKENEQAAMSIVEILGSHTVAIIQAGAFVRQKHCTLEEYPSIFQQQRDKLLKFHSGQNESTYGNVYATFEVAAEYLQNSESPECSDALNLLHTLAFMYRNGLSETVLQRASQFAFKLKDSKPSEDEKVLSLSVRHVARLPVYLQQGWSPSGRLRWRSALRTLESLSILSTGMDTGLITISLHPLVHVWAKERQARQIRSEAWQMAATVLALSCESHYGFSPFFTILQPQARACVDHEVETYTQDMPTIEVAQILFQFAYVLLCTGDESSLSSLVQQIRSIMQHQHGAEPRIALQVQIFTAIVARQQGNYKEAVSIFRGVVEARGGLAEDHPDRLNSQHELATAYRENGQIDEAVELFERIVKVKEKLLAKDDRSRLTSQQGLGITYRANGQIDEAVDLLEHIVQVQEKGLAEDHPTRLTSQYILAITYQDNGQIGEAVELLERVVKVEEKLLAEDDPSRLSSQYALASTYQDNGQIDEAVELLEHVVKVKEKLLAEDNPSRLTSQYALAIAYQDNGQIDEAVKLLEHVVQVDGKKLAEDNPDRLLSQDALADAYLERETLRSGQYNTRDYARDRAGS